MDSLKNFPQYSPCQKRCDNYFYLNFLFRCHRDKIKPLTAQRPIRNSSCCKESASIQDASSPRGRRTSLSPAPSWLLRLAGQHREGAQEPGEQGTGQLCAGLWPSVQGLVGDTEVAFSSVINPILWSRWLEKSRLLCNFSHFSQGQCQE